MAVETRACHRVAVVAVLVALCWRVAGRRPNQAVATESLAAHAGTYLAANTSRQRHTRWQHSLLQVTHTRIESAGFVDFQKCAQAPSCTFIGSGATLSAGGGVQLGGTEQAPQCMCRQQDPTLHSPPGGSGSPEDPPCFTEQGVAPLAHDIWDGYLWDTVAEIARKLEPSRGASGTKPAVYLIGDSHAVHLRWVFSADCAPLKDHSFRMYTSWSPLLKEFFERTLIAGDVVVLSYQFEHYHAEGFSEGKAAWIHSVSKLAQARKAAILLLGDVPRKTGYHRSPTAGGADCVRTKSRPWLPAACEMSKEEVEKEFAPMYQMWESLSNQSNVFFFNFYQLLCGATSCDAFIPGTKSLAYMDGNHMTKGATLYLRPYMCAAMAQTLAAI